MRMSAIIGHRGAAHIAPENTLSGIKAAYQSGLDWVELDVILMGDGSLIMHHDRTLSRCTNGKGEVLSKSIGYLDGIDAGVLFRDSHGDRFFGEPIPTLLQALDLVHALGMGLNLEIKMHQHEVGDLVLPVLSVLDGHPLSRQGRVLISSFNHQVLLLCKQQRPDIPLGQLFGMMPKNWLSLTKEVNAVTVHVNQSWLTEAKVKTVLEQGYELYCYTVNDGKRAKNLLDWGVSGVFTDDPAAIKCML